MSLSQRFQGSDDDHEVRNFARRSSLPILYPLTRIEIARSSPSLFLFQLFLRTWVLLDDKQSSLEHLPGCKSEIDEEHDDEENKQYCRDDPKEPGVHLDGKLQHRGRECPRRENDAVPCQAPFQISLECTIEHGAEGDDEPDRAHARDEEAKQDTRRFERRRGRGRQECAFVVPGKGVIGAGCRPE